MVAEALGLPAGFFDACFSDPILTLRPIHYTAEQSDASNGILAAGMSTYIQMKQVHSAANTQALHSKTTDDLDIHTSGIPIV